jgi:A/G-specific adenine glycosylase
MLAPTSPGEFNQALMELGARVCLPRNPMCLQCPWQKLCEAKKHGVEREFPVKKETKPPDVIEKTVLVFRRGQDVLLWRRGDQELRMAGFWELPEPGQIPGVRVGKVLGSFSHAITHHRFVVYVREARGRRLRGFAWKQMNELVHLPLSTIARKSLRWVVTGTTGSE